MTTVYEAVIALAQSADWEGNVESTLGLSWTTVELTAREMDLMWEVCSDATDENVFEKWLVTVNSTGQTVCHAEGMERLNGSLISDIAETFRIVLAENEDQD